MLLFILVQNLDKYKDIQNASVDFTKIQQDQLQNIKTCSKNTIYKVYLKKRFSINILHIIKNYIKNVM